MGDTLLIEAGGSSQFGQCPAEYRFQGNVINYGTFSASLGTATSSFEAVGKSFTNNGKVFVSPGHTLDFATGPLCQHEVRHWRSEKV